jgi:Na+/serine symporter
MSRTKTNLLILAGIIVGGVLGVVLGQAMPELMAKVGLLGKLYANALFFVASLLILAGTVAGANEAWHYRQSGFFGPRLYVISSAVLSAVVFCAFVFFIGRYSLAAGGSIQAVYAFDSSFPDYLMNLIPQTTLSGVFSGQYLGWFILALLLGAVLHQMTSRGRTIASFFSELCGGLRRVNNLLFYAAPVGALFLFAGCSGLTTASITELLNPYALLLGMIVYNTVVLPWLVQSWSRRRLEEAWDKDRVGSDQQSGGYRGRQQRNDSGRDRYERGGDRNRGNRPQPGSSRQTGSSRQIGSSRSSGTQ